jgi:hypothetical protein
VYNKTVPDDDFIKSKHVLIKTQVFLLVVLTDKIKSIYMKAYLISHRWLWLCVPRWKAQNTCFLVSSKRGIQIEVSVSGLLEHGMTKGAIGSSVGTNI